MNIINSVKQGDVPLVSVRAYAGDAMTLLAFDLDASLLPNFVGFSIAVKQGDRPPYYLLNRLSFSQAILDLNGIDAKEKLSTLYSPIQKFRWVHVPATQHFISAPFFGNYTYSITPRFLVNNLLKPLDPALTVSSTISVSPFKSGDIQVGFARGFISSEAYVDRFGNNIKLRPEKNTDLIFNTSVTSGEVNRWDSQSQSFVLTPYPFIEQYEYLGWQARDRVMEFLDEVLQDPTRRLDVFAYDFDEPLIADKLNELAIQNRLRVILDNTPDHTGKGCSENQFEALFAVPPKDKNAIFRGHFKSLAHSKIFIQRIGDKSVKVLTGSTNFSINGLCVNANHVLIFSNENVAAQYAKVFDASFGKDLMANFDQTDLAKTDFIVHEPQIPDMTIRFSPHPRVVADKFFKSISDRIDGAKSDVLFAIMNDRSKSDILAAVRRQVQSDNVFTYGIVDIAKDVSLYKPGSKRGIRVAGKGTETVLPPPFNQVPKIDGVSIHHKFIVVDFKGKESVVYCGSSNLAYNPEQSNGDNLIEIRDDDVVTVFAIEAIRLVDHFHWRNTKRTAAEAQIPLNLSDNTNPNKLWYASYYDSNDLHFLERTLLIREKLTA